MNPRDFDYASSTYGATVPSTEAPAKSQFDLDMENATPYFGNDFPGDEGLTCRKCGAAVNLGWQHIEWHEAA